MVSTHREVERKYDVGAGAALPDLGGLAGVADVSAPEQHALEAVYFDTADLRLAAARITLRRRTGGEDAGWHLKLPVGSGIRDEVRLPLGRAKAAPPRELRSAVLAFTRGEPLVPVATIRTSRTVRRLLAEDGSHLAEVSEDDVRAFAGSEDPSLVAWREWEVELVDADAELLDRVDAVMGSAGASVGRSPSKLARVLGDHLTAPAPPSPRRKGPAGQVLQARLAAQVAALKRQDVDVRLDVHDGVHQLRVAMRRLRSALATFRPLVDRGRTDPLRDELRWIAGLLGEARDAEVMAQRLEREVSGLPAELVLGAVTARIDHTLGTRYREGLARAVEAMESQRYLDLLADLDSLVADPPWTPEADGRAKDVVPALLRRDWKRLRTRVAALEPDLPGQDAVLHECRKAAKGLRYAAEAAEPVLRKRAGRVRRAAKEAQTVLGEHQDTVVTRQALREMGVAAQLDGDSAFTFGLLYGREERRAAALQEEFVRAWESELGPALRRGVR